MDVGRAGFGTAVLNGCWREKYDYHDDITARALYLEKGENRVLVVVTDLSYFARSSAWQVRQYLSKKSGVPVENVVLYTTQNHCAPGEREQLNIPEISGRCLDASLQAISGTHSAMVSLTVADVNGQFSINRRKYINHRLGTLTFWYGYRIEGGRADARNLVRHFLRTLLGPNPATTYAIENPSESISDVPRAEEVPELAHPIWFDRYADPLVQLLVFQTLEGQPLGSLIRFSAHPGTANRIGAFRYSGDFPYYVRQALERELGGIAIFATGPCGNIVCKVDVKSFELARRVGEELAEVTLKSFRESKETFHPIELLKTSSQTVDLPIRPDFPSTVEEAKIREREVRQKLKEAVVGHAPLREIKKLADQATFLSYVPHMLNDWVKPTLEEIKQKRLSVELHGFRINDVIVVGLPGEGFAETSLGLRANSLGRKLIVLEECNGYIVYIPTPDDFPGGSYEVNCAIIAENGEPILRSGAIQLIQQLGNNATAYPY